MNNEFDLPFYLVEELTSYLEATAKGENKSSQWNNIVALIGLAKVNDRITQEQATFLIQEFNRENLQ